MFRKQGWLSNLFGIKGKTLCTGICSFANGGEKSESASYFSQRTNKKWFGFCDLLEAEQGPERNEDQTSCDALEGMAAISGC